MPKITFVSQSSRNGGDVALSPERLINLYPEIAPEGALGRYLLRSVLGQSAFSSVSVPNLRAMEVVGDVIYAVGGAQLWSINAGGIATPLGAVADDVVTTISGNGSLVTIAAGGNYYVWNGSSMMTPGSGAFTSEGSVTFHNQRTIITEKDGGKFEWTDLADATTRQAANVASAEGKNDNILRGMTIGNELWLFGEESSEVWYNTGQGGANAYARLAGGVLENGLLAANLVVKVDSGAFFIGDDKVAYITQGAQFAPVATPAVLNAINASTPTHVLYYEEMGHKFCCIRFSDRPAWCYDISMGVWHERSTGTANGAWEVVATVRFNNEWYAGTDDGGIYKMQRTNADVNYPLRRLARSRAFYLDGEQFSVSSFELLGTFGESSLGRDAQAMLRISRDSGRTFGDELPKSLGDTGDRGTRAVWRGLGRGRNFVAEVVVTDPADISLYSDANIQVR